MKKLIPMIAMYLGSFVAINTGMYFFLDATQPKTNTQVLLAANADSAKVEEGKADDPHKSEEIKPMESKEITSTKSGEVENGKADQHTNENEAIDKAKADQKGDIAAQKSKEEPKQEIEKTPVVETKQPVKEPVVEPDASALAAIAGNSKEMVKLSKMLESMKPAEAAAVLTNLKDEAVVSLVMKMKERNAAKILAAMPIDQAARVAEKMAEMADVAGRK